VLYIVLVLVLAALGLLVTALLTANTVWAWVSVVLSVLAGLFLLADWLRRRSKRRAAEAVPTEQPNNEAAAEEDDAEKVSGDVPEAGETPAAEQTELMPSAGDLDSSSTAIIVPVPEEDTEDDPAEGVEEEDASPALSKSDGDPGEEETDAADLLVVSELEDQVVVVDEYPRYHLVECVWLAERDTIPIEVSEARQLGFTPCVRCGPDAKLATKHRAKSG
jgi:membrane protein implicated in regulation of membrane protease activity